VPRLPDQFVERPKKFDPIIDKLLDDEHQNPVALTTALQGGGGFGKTVLAIAICHDPRIRAAFDDGILWLQFRENTSQADVVTMLNGAIRELGGEGNHTAEQFSAASAEWHSLLKDRDMLIVLDDVWKAHLPQHVLLGEHDSKGRTAFIITTRKADVVARASADKVQVDMLDEGEDLQLLAKYVSDKIDDFSPLDKLVPLLGRWALLIDLTGAQLRVLMESNRTLDDAINYIKTRFEERGITFMERGVEDEKNRNTALSTSLDASIAQFPKIPPNFEQRFYELSIFPEDTKVSVDAVQRLWRGTGGYSDTETEDALEIMNQLSLFLYYQPNVSFQLHDVIRQVIALRLEDAQSTHQKLIEEYGDLTQLPDVYAWRNFAYHLCGAAQISILRELLLTFDYLQNKLNATDPNALIADCDYLPDDRIIYLIQSAIRLCAHIVQNDLQLFSSSLSKHLSYYMQSQPEITTLFNKTSQKELIPTLPTFSNYAPAGDALFRILTGHTDSITSVVLSGKYAVSASQDKTLKVWNCKTGDLLRTLSGHTASVTDVVLSGEYVVSASIDRTLMVWNWHTGELLRTLEGHRSRVNKVSLSGEYVVSTSDDNTLKIWNWQRGELLRTLEGHTHAVTSVSLHHEYAVSASADRTLKVWNWQMGELLRTLNGHTHHVNSVSLSDEYAISTSKDMTLRVWNWQSGELLQTLEGHTTSIGNLIVSDEIIVINLFDKTIRVWNWKTGELRRTSEKYATERIIHNLSPSYEYSVSISSKELKVWNKKSVTNFSLLTNKLPQIVDNNKSSTGDISVSGRYAVIASADKTLKVWNWHTGELLRTLKGHTASIGSVSLSGEYAVSASQDNTLKVWNFHTSQLLYTLEGHTHSVSSVSLLGEFAISVSLDNTLKVWNWHTGKLLRTIKGVAKWVNSVSLSDEVTVSASSDHTLQVWNWHTGELLRTLKGHTASIGSVSLSGEYVISASSDQTLKVWNWRSGDSVRTLKGHTATISSVSLCGKCAVSTSYDSTLKIWNWYTGELITTFYADKPLFCNAIAENYMCIIAGDNTGNVHFLRPNSALLALLQNNN
jgi:WD40 repeat protein